MRNTTDNQSSHTEKKATILQLVLKTSSDLQSAYIPLFEDGGIFVPTMVDYALGDEVYVLLTIPEDTQRYAVTGKVGWINPPNCPGNHPQGIGVAFPKEEKFFALRQKIEDFLATNNKSIQSTHIF